MHDFCFTPVYAAILVFGGMIGFYAAGSATSLAAGKGERGPPDRNMGMHASGPLGRASWRSWSFLPISLPLPVCQPTKQFPAAHQAHVNTCLWRARSTALQQELGRNLLPQTPPTPAGAISAVILGALCYISMNHWLADKGKCVPAVVGSLCEWVLLDGLAA